MLRKIASALAVAFAVTLAFASTASAAPYDPATFSVTALGGNAYQVSGSGWGDEVADEYVTITLTYGSAPQGLRAAPALAAAAKADSYTAAVDSDGNFSAVVSASQDGPVYFTVTGYPSGQGVVGELVTDTGGSGVTTTTAGMPGGSGSGSSGSGGSGSSAGSGSGSSGGSGSGSSSGGYYSSGSGSSGGSQGAYNSDYAATGGYSSGNSLASTGASIAGPMAIGIGTLTVGLGLLFFGTRGVIRRKGARTSH